MRGHEPGERESTVVTAELCLCADRVAVVEDLGAGIQEPDHRLDLLRHGCPRLGREPLGVRFRGSVPLLHAHALRQVAQRVVRAGLVRDDVDGHSAAQKLGEHRCGIADEADGERTPLVLRGGDARDRIVEVIRQLVEIPVVDAALQPCSVHVDDEHGAVVHRHGERLRAAHAAASAGQGERAGERSATFSSPWPAGRDLLGDRGERLVRPLQDALASDVDPAARCHLAVHGQPSGFEPAELRPRRPVRHQVRVGDEHTRRPLMRAEDADRLAGLHEQGLVGIQRLQRAHDGVERLPAAGGPPCAAVHHEVLRSLGDLGVEVVHDHAQRRFGLPRLCPQRRAVRRVDGQAVVHGVLLRLPPLKTGRSRRNRHIWPVLVRRARPCLFSGCRRSSGRGGESVRDGAGDEVSVIGGGPSRIPPR